MICGRQVPLTRSADGHELHMAVNHLAPWLLSTLLLARLASSALTAAQPARVLTVTCLFHSLGYRDRQGSLRTAGIKVEVGWRHCP